MALPSDVRKGSAFPKPLLIMILARLRLSTGVAIKSFRGFAGKASLSAHQAAKPQKTMLTLPLLVV